MAAFHQGLFSQSSAKGARSTALHALQWALALILAAIPASVWVGAPTWLTCSLLVAVIMVLVVFLCAYVYLLLRNPDALRSEEFFLSKMAIEKGLVGDSTTGFVEPQSLPAISRSALTISADQGESK